MIFSKPRGTAKAELTIECVDDGVRYGLRPSDNAEWWLSPHALPEAIRASAAYLSQLLNEGIATGHDGAVLLPWHQVFALRANEEHAQSLSLLCLPPDGSWAPCLESRGTPSDADFTVAVAAWQSAQSGRRHLVRSGAALRVGDAHVLMSEAAWRTCLQVAALARHSGSMSPNARLRALGEIRTTATNAGAVFDDYLAKTNVVSPHKVEIELRRSDALGVPVVEVRPQPEGAPENFLEVFDRFDSVRGRYDVVQADGGLVHVAPDDSVGHVLETVKRMPGRRMSSEQARLFGYSPFAVLGEEARSALDEEALIQARAEADLLPWRLTFHAPGGGEAASIELVPMSETQSPVLMAVTPALATALLQRSGQSRARSLPLFQWEGFEIELNPATEAALGKLARWLATASLEVAGLTLDDILNLDAYSDRVVGFDARVQTVPYVAKRESATGWVPENLEVGIAAVDRETGQVQRVPLDETSLVELKQRIAKAEAEGAVEVTLPKSDVRVPIERARELSDALGRADIAVSRKKTRIDSPCDPKPDGKRPNLQILHNIENLEYVTREVDAFDTAPPGRGQVPNALRDEIRLLPHQETGLAWLQHRYGLQPSGLSGCLLADDMGLGKTLQSLCLMAWHHEQSSNAKPCLVVAPVSLLENWKAEIARFLHWSDGDVLSLYGGALSSLRVASSSLDPGLADAGIRKLLRPGFEAGYKLVLTTYETLRDYEFSLARVDWSVVVCDEAQKIKNPAAFVTQAAKALRADFRIACTGTPVENSLADLWCLFDFFQPGYLGSLNGFTRDYRRGIETRADGHESLVEQLRSSTQPWVLRRMKHEVHRGLPRKVEREDADSGSMKLSMSALQSQLYAQSVSEYRASRESGAEGAGTQVLALLARLRTICAHPLAVVASDHERRPVADHAAASPKLAWLLRRLAGIRMQGEKAIVFTEFRDLQRLIQRAVAETFGYSAQIINGSTSVDARSDDSRQRVIDRFQAEQGFGVIILSTTAVGFGVNIQAANHVIHFTRPWNPAKEDQATDRAYRIGQTRDVYVYCPTVVGDGFESFEERLSALLDEKRALSRDMLSGVQEVTAEDFLGL